MVDFDFVTGDAFRKSLESDYQELEIAMNGHAWKSAHVLAGSIVEAILRDYLIDIKYARKPEDEILRMDLGTAVDACGKAGLLSSEAVHISYAVRDYRNLIHAGRVLRTKSQVNEDSAKVAQALVAMIISQVAEKRTKKFGYTAKQIVTKLFSDDSVGSILSHLLKETTDTERRRLLLDLLPEAYYHASHEAHGRGLSADLPALRNGRECFHIAFTLSSDEVKTEVAQHFVTILKEHSGELVSMYEGVFYYGYQLGYLAPDDQALVKSHVLSRMSKDGTLSRSALIRIVSGLGPFLADNHEGSQFLSLLLTRVTVDDDPHLTLRSGVADEIRKMTARLQESAMTFLEARIKSCRQDHEDHEVYTSGEF